MVLIKLYKYNPTQSFTMNGYALYIGAGTDTLPFIHCNWINNYICIDSQPYSEYGTLQSGTLDAHGNDTYSRPEFLDDLDVAYEKIGFRMKKSESNPRNMRWYSNFQTNIFYYVNTAIPNHHYLFKHAFKDINALVVSGHDPDSILLDYTSKRLDFIGIEGTCYDAEENPDNPNSILSRLHRGDIQCHFSKYYFIHKDGTKKMFRLWDDFMFYYEGHPIQV
jgi:hypothetical protein